MMPNKFPEYAQFVYFFRNVLLAPGNVSRRNKKSVFEKAIFTQKAKSIRLVFNPDILELEYIDEETTFYSHQTDLPRNN